MATSRPGSQARLGLLVLLGGSMVAAAGALAGDGGFGVSAVSARPGHLFTDSDDVDVRVRVAGAKGAAAIEFTVAEGAPPAGGKDPWRGSGRVEVDVDARGAGEARLPLGLPGRGLYELELRARSGDSAAACRTWVAVVFTPRPPDEASPWGIFYTPHVWFDRDNPDGARDAAVSHRLLGASWSRLNFWAHSFGKVTVSPGGDGPGPGDLSRDVRADWSQWREYARELRREGIHIFGEIAQCPRELSSSPDDEAVAGDAGPVYNRVKPRDYGLWDSLMERLARDFREEIGVWEVWNEANLPNRYWTGTVEDFAELVEHTSRALRRGNPDARIAAAGFVHGHDFADRLFQLGMGRHIDILTVHYTDEHPEQIEGYRRLLAKHGLSMPIWNSEEKSEVPLRNIAGGIERSFKFIHVHIGYPDYRPLVRKDMTVLPAGIHFSVGAHCIGSARFLARHEGAPGCEVFLFRRGRETVAAIDPGRGGSRPRLFGGSASSVTLEVKPLGRRGDGRPRVTDIWGRTRPLEVKGGRATVELGGGMLFVNGCREVDVVSAGGVAGEPGARAFEAESGSRSAGWGISAKPGFSDGRIVEIWRAEDPGPEGYWVEVPMDVPRAGRYEVLFSGNSLERLGAPRSISSFDWSIDGGEAHAVDDAVPVTEGVAGAPEGLGRLGEVELSAGRHKFRLVLAARREKYDTNYALWFDAVGLRRLED